MSYIKTVKLIDIHEINMHIWLTHGLFELYAVPTPQYLA
jgi:hypothetical protein